VGRGTNHPGGGKKKIRSGLPHRSRKRDKHINRLGPEGEARGDKTNVPLLTHPRGEGGVFQWQGDRGNCPDQKTITTWRGGREGVTKKKKKKQKKKKPKKKKNTTKTPKKTPWEEQGGRFCSKTKNWWRLQEGIEGN